MLLYGQHLFEQTGFICKTPTKNMKAKFATQCISCGDKIQPGKEISKNKDEKWVHKHCAEDSEGLP